LAAAQVGEPRRIGLTIVRLLPKHGYRRVRWKNGLGWTSEIAVEPPEGEWNFRLSIAEVDADSEFSRFPGIDRSLVVLDGAGMVLDVEGQGSATLTADGPPLAFPGDVATSSRLLAGPTRDFNVMTRRGVVSHALRRQALAGSLELSRAPASLLVIHSVDGHVELDELALAPGDTAIVEDRETVTLTGSASVLLVELRRL
jgi:environmental stress-induced protein Ves